MNYVGSELALFQHAENWKRYWSGAVKPYVQGRVLDVGCGFGVNATYVSNEGVTSYTFLEPDAELLGRVEEFADLPKVEQHHIHGTTKDLNNTTYNTLLYIDVLEHIEDAQGELRRAYELLAVGGHLIIVVPAFQFLYSPFDKAIGHYRRYDRKLLAQHVPTSFQKVCARYLDSTGLLLSLGNRLLLRKAAPTRAQIDFWDKRVVPCSRLTDKLVFHSIGRSLIAVYRKP